MQCLPMPALTRVEVDKKMAARAKANFIMVLEIWVMRMWGAKSGCFTVELGDKFWTRRYLYIPNNGRESGAFGLA